MISIEELNSGLMTTLNDFRKTIEIRFNDDEVKKALLIMIDNLNENFEGLLSLMTTDEITLDEVNCYSSEVELSIQLIEDYLEALE